MPTDPLLIDLPEYLDGPRVRVRPYEAGDGMAVYEAVNEDVDHLLPYMVWARKHETPEDSELMARRCRANWEARTDLTMGMWDRKSGRYLGGSGLHRIQWEIPAFEIGYWIRATAQGNGYVTEVVRLLTDFAFDQLQANRVFLRVDKENTRSLAIPRRLGFLEEGLLRNAVIDADGVLRDLVIFSKIPSDRR